MIARCLRALVRFFAVCCELCGKSSGAAGHWLRGTTSARPSAMLRGIAARLRLRHVLFGRIEQYRVSDAEYDSSGSRSLSRFLE